VWIAHDKGLSFIMQYRIGKNVAVGQLHFFLILNTINPQILDLATLRFERLQTSGKAKNVLDEYNSDIKKFEDRVKQKGDVLLKEEEVELSSETVFGLGKTETSELSKICRGSGGEFETRTKYTCVDIRGNETPSGTPCEFIGGQNTSFYSPSPTTPTKKTARCIR